MLGSAIKTYKTIITTGSDDLDDLTITLIRAGSMASIVTFMLSRGLEVRHGDLWYLGSRRVLLLKSLLSVDVIVPLITIAVIILVRPAKATAIGMLILSAAPVAPMILKKILQSGGTREYAINLHLILAVLTIVSTPITLDLFSVAAGFHLDINPVAIAGLVGLSVILPISGGMIIKQLFPSVSKHIKWLLEAFSGALFIIVTIVRPALHLSVTFHDGHQIVYRHHIDDHRFHHSRPPYGEGTPGRTNDPCSRKRCTKHQSHPADNLDIHDTGESVTHYYPLHRHIGDHHDDLR